MKKFLALAVFLINISLIYCQPYITVANVPLQTLINDTLIAVCNSNVISNITTPNCTSKISYFNQHGSAFPFQTGILLTTGGYTGAPGPDNVPNMSSGITCGVTDADLQMLAGYQIKDVAKIEFDFTPSISPISFRYIFASEEFPEYANSQYNDAFGFFLSGPGISSPGGISGSFTNNAIIIAELPNGLPATITNIYNSGLYPQGYYVGALSPSTGATGLTYGNSIQFDGASIILTATANVIVGQTYHIKIAVGDAGDDKYDSAVFLETGSFIIQDQGGVYSITDGLGANAGMDSITTLDCYNSAIDLLAYGGNTYQWSGGLYPNQAQNTVTQHGTYTVTITSNLCNKIEIHSITIDAEIVYPNVFITSNSTELTCYEPTIELIATGGGSYLWNTSETTSNINVTTPGIYSVTVTTPANGCTATTDYEITQDISSPSDVSITSDDANNELTCSTTSITLTASGGTTYLWSTGEITNSITISQPDTYTVTAIGANGCYSSSTSVESIVITQNITPPTVNISSLITELTCYEPTIELTATGGGNYLWNISEITSNINVTTPEFIL
ncbi:hypothetical protein AGMMS49959_16920 [Planctomycetales bacterium]|nr:hypothetical protein AGMMS49959_16920 [Planctomycetales bacterium]